MNELPLNQILCGNCAELLQDFPDNSVDLVVTDPPYGLSFMGKEWDKALPSREAFKQIIRVLKPGGLAFVMSSPRQDLLWRMCALLEGVGFEMRQSFISWIYKTGMPKAYDVSKGIDKRKGGLIDRDSLGVFIKKHREKIGLSRQDASELVTGNRTGAFWNWENNYCLPRPELWPKIKEAIKAPDSEWDKKISSAEREKIRKGKPHVSGEGMENSWNSGYKIDYDITTPSSDLAKMWNGWKSQTGLKPALEPILMVNKPFSESTIVDNVLRWGTGAVNVDACRIPIGADKIPLFDRRDKNGIYGGSNDANRTGDFTNQGRFPANLLVSDGALDTGEQSKSGTLEPYHIINGDGEGHKSGKVYGTFTKVEAKDHVTYGDQGDQSRYFDLDIWAQHHGFLDVPKPDTSERDYGLRGVKREPKSKFNKSDGKNERFDGAVSIPRRNTHPTVKPIKLMAYLIELGCPRNGVVLDPFVGSGTTCIAAKQLGRRYIGIEIKPEYHVLAEARVAAYPDPLEWFMEVKYNE